MDRVPWNVSSDDLAILSIHNKYGGLHYLYIHAVGKERCLDASVNPTYPLFRPSLVLKPISYSSIASIKMGSRSLPTLGMGFR
ncbi:hypothetical protein PENARI_c004G05187 [Penicillium arizonense]|uniref:Uncharacterized protein n=1 Tax=Penicillium arizonense TaxID=1835702 RepID=A0A1F5LRP1_PENAI|nr:hypothetical protein PENARI_c004G05187 [Penicillium arizonense]OGE55797.1 hypothetical protein PENARI_c004G05187 [Penicillium arizonense]